MNINLDFLPTELTGTTVPKPLSGTLSGHAAGEPFDKNVYSVIKRHYPTNTFRQFEYLNKVYADNMAITDVQKRLDLLPTQALKYLLNRGIQPTKKWTTDEQFDEKQNDTADILVVKDNFFNIIDVKTFNTEKNGQPPNIISALKIANMCALMIEGSDYSTHDITYVEISWELQGDNLQCKNVAIRELFKSNPSDLYINWAAAMQIQFHVASLKQEYAKTVKDWCTDYLKSFTGQAKARADKMIRDYVKPFQKYL